MYHTEDILAGARIIRYYLKQPLQLNDADDLERKLGVLLQPTDDPDRVADEVMDLLAQHETTTAWMQHFLESSNHERNFQPLPGRADPPPATIYTCPPGGCRWVIRSIGDPPQCCQQNGEPMGTTQQPWCPNHNVALQRFERP